MKTLRTLLMTAVGTAVLGLTAFAGKAQAFQVGQIASDADFNSLLKDLAFVGEGRIGDRDGRATFELDIHEDNPGVILSGDSAQFNWQNNTPYNFTLSFNKATKTATYTVGNVTLDYAVKDQFRDIFIRTRAASGSTASITNLVLNGQTINGGSFASNPGDDVDYLWIRGLKYDNFTLTGISNFAWTTTSAAPRNSALAYQVKVGTAQAVPEPSTMLGLAAVTAIGVVLKRQQKKTLA